MIVKLLSSMTDRGQLGLQFSLEIEHDCNDLQVLTLQERP